MNIRTQGLGDEVMEFYPGPSSCGDVKDGVSFSIGNGGWVVSFADFERMYKAAIGARYDPDAARFAARTRIARRKARKAIQH